MEPDVRFKLNGSSPLARGTRRGGSRRGGEQRIIPARAGNTAGALNMASIPPDHPRSRGEHPICRAASAKVSGSSPLARGTPPAPVCRRARGRIIPARAGNTSAPRPSRICGSDHPRSRGEHMQSKCNANRMLGSSPLARGTLDRRHVGEVFARIIPARAGNTLILRS